jgi:two-component system sensor histidine kinase UhpB
MIAVKTGWSLKWRLSLLLTSLFVGVFLIAFMAYVVSARYEVGRESLAVAKLAEAMLGIVPQSNEMPRVPIQALRKLDHARHIRAMRSGEMDQSAHPYPDWFAHLFEEGNNHWSRTIMVTDGGIPLYQMVLYSTPDDELSEKWDDVMHLVSFAGVLLLILNLGAWAIVYWQLYPLKALSRALESVGLGERDVKVTLSNVEEVAAVQRGFNEMADALKEASDGNRRLTRELLRVQEEERKVIARELHDEFAQQLTAIDAESAALKYHALEKPAALASVNSIREASQTLMRMVRGRLEQLRPEMLDEFGVVSAIEELCDHFAQTHPTLNLSVDLPSELSMSDELSIALFRILQESFTNITRHANATQVDVGVYVRNDGERRFLDLTVADDGKGVNLESERRRGFGLLGMSERVESLGGNFKLAEGIDGRGVAVSVTLPLTPKQVNA